MGLYLEFWFNGVSVQGLNWNGIVTQGVNERWSTQGHPPLQLQSFGLGRLQLNDHQIAWFDDVALAGTRIGCLKRLDQALPADTLSSEPTPPRPGARKPCR